MVFDAGEACSHGAGIDDIDGSIGAVVDTGNHEVDAVGIIVKEDVKREFDTIGWHAVGDIDVHFALLFVGEVGIVGEVYLVHSHGFTHGDGIGHATSRSVGCNYRDMAELGHEFGEDGDTLCSPAVIVGD